MPPYQDKPKFHLTKESFDSARLGYRFSAENRLEFKNDQMHAVLESNADGYTYENESINAILNIDYSARQVEFKNSATESFDLKDAARMAILFEAVQAMAPFTPRLH